MVSENLQNHLDLLLYSSDFEPFFPVLATCFFPWLYSWIIDLNQCFFALFSPRNCVKCTRCWTRILLCSAKASLSLFCSTFSRKRIFHTWSNRFCLFLSNVASKSLSGILGGRQKSCRSLTVVFLHLKIYFPAGICPEPPFPNANDSGRWSQPIWMVSPVLFIYLIISNSESTNSLVSVPSVCWVFDMILRSLLISFQVLIWETCWQSVRWMIFSFYSWRKSGKSVDLWNLTW